MTDDPRVRELQREANVLRHGLVDAVNRGNVEREREFRARLDAVYLKLKALGAPR